MAWKPLCLKCMHWHRHFTDDPWATPCETDQAKIDAAQSAMEEAHGVCNQLPLEGNSR